MLQAPSLVHWEPMRNIPSDMPPPDAPSQTPEVMAPLCSVFRRFLRSKSLKYTPERAEVLNAIIARDGVFEVEELLLEMQGMGHRISKATIYRTINLLVDAGIITQALFDSKQAHYRLIYGQEPHDHMLCMRTGKLIEFSSPELSELRDRICRELGWEPVGHRFQIYALSPSADAETDADETES
jgi:Fur family ferric uptake transcriptional regulator